MTDTAYDAWEKQQRLSPASLESFYAEHAWNAALRAAKADMADRGMSWEAGVLDTLITDLPLSTLETHK